MNAAEAMGIRVIWRAALFVLLGLSMSCSHRAVPIAADTSFKEAPRPVIGALRKPLDDLPQIENFKVIGHNVLPNPGDTRPRGRNGPIGISGDCLYVGSRVGHRPGTGPAFGKPALPPDILIVDISDPDDPEVVGSLPTALNATSRELRTIPDLHTLIVLSSRETGPDNGSVNNYQIYDIRDCRHPVLTQTIPLGVDRPHGFFLWRDPRNPLRFLLFTSGSTQEPSLRVFELANPPRDRVSPEPVATFTLTPAESRPPPIDLAAYRADPLAFDSARPASPRDDIHSLSVSQDGTRTYLVSTQGSYFILDSSRLARGLPCTPHSFTAEAKSTAAPGLCLRDLDSDPNARVDFTPSSGWTEHSMYPVPGRPYLIVSGERNGTDACPWSWGTILDISVERSPRAISRYLVPENLVANCFVGGPGDPALQREFSPHQQLVFPNLFFISWYSAGLRAWDISNPVLPLEVGVFVPRPETDVVEPFRNSPDVWVGLHPILYNGLIYIADENSGLYVLRYKGDRAEELPKKGLFISNTNFLSP
ncbi:hypothetical protein DAT35_20230 [Vitiosangium sp. GDMCC 1.1324]|nr:hypothetical protein DAT35_20230 [Vitiosangium sp. GDMCC 1.1324]